MSRHTATACQVASFYRFERIGDPPAHADALRRACAARGLKGTILVAPEGVNVALAGTCSRLQSFLAEHFADVDANWTPATSAAHAFKRLRVRVRDEIVTSGHALLPATPVGRHVEAAQWQRLLDDPDVLVLDVRNEYESRIGTFPGAKPANTARFREFARFAGRELSARRHPRIAMFCTGGVRCEKASAHLLANGFADVCQLRGGIVRYLREVGPANSAFEGECFVFDGRVSLRADMGEGTYWLCERCGGPTPKAGGTTCAECQA